MGLQLLTLLLWLVVLIRPSDIPDPFELGPSLSWTAICLAAAGGIWIAELAAVGAAPRGLVRVRSGLDWPLAIYLAAVALTSIWSTNHQGTLVAGLALAGHVGMFYATVLLIRRAAWLGEAVLALLVAALAMLLTIALAFHAALGLLTRPKDYLEPAGWSGYPELAVLGVVQFGLLVGALQTASGRSAFASAALIAVNLIQQVFLYARASWPAMALIGIVATVLAVCGAKQARRPLIRLALVLAVTAVLGGLLVALNPTLRYLARVSLQGEQAWSTAPAGLALEVAAPGQRIDLWRRTVRMIGDHPFVGVGLGNFREVFERDYHPEIAPDGRRGVHAHNLWLQQFAELGLAGGTAYVTLWVALFIVAWQRARAALSFASVGVLLALVGMAASNMTTNMFYLTGGASGRLQSLTWLLIGIAVAARSEGGVASGRRQPPTTDHASRTDD